MLASVWCYELNYIFFLTRWTTIKGNTAASLSPKSVVISRTVCSFFKVFVGKLQKMEYRIDRPISSVSQEFKKMESVLMVIDYHNEVHFTSSLI